MAATRAEALSLYRSLLRHIKVLPKDQAANTQKVREAFRIHYEDEAIGQALEAARSKLSFLRISIPARLRPKMPQQGETRSLYDGGEVVYSTDKKIKEPTKAKMYNQTLRDEDIKRHHELNERMHFRGKCWDNGKYVGPAKQYWPEEW